MKTISKEYKYELKVFVAGERMVGKTCFIQRLADCKFNRCTIMTICSSTCYLKKVINDKEICCQIIDIGGKNAYKLISIMNSKNSNIGFILYDLTSRESFEEAKYFWIPNFKEYAKNQHCKLL